MFARMFLFILSFLATSQYVVANVPRKPDITITFGNLTLSLGAVDTKGNSLSLKDVQLHADTLSMIGDSLSQKQRINNVYEYVEYPELVNSINESVNPCEDFYEFVCQGWQNKQTIEPYENVISQFRLARDEVFLRLKKILSEQREKDRVDDLFYIVYEKCMDKNAQNSLRSKPLLNMLRKLQDVHPEYLTDWLIEVSPVTVFVTFSVETDQMNSTRNTLELNMVKAEMLHDYFIDEKYRDRVEAFKDYLWQIMQLLIDDDPNQEFFSKNAEAVNRSIDSFVDVETQMSLILNESDPHADDHEAFYNLYGFDELQAVMPAINLTKLFIAIAPKELLDKIDLKNLTVVVPEPDSLKSLDSLIQAMSASNLRNYLRWKLILAYVPFLDERFEDVQLKFDTVMYGIVNKEPRWMQCVRVSINFLTDIANALYVKEYVPPNSLADLRILMDNVRYSFENLLKENEWMDNETKGRALLKVKELVAFIAYDEKSITKEALEKKYTLVSSISYSSE
ncbi:hypothetical protein AB6A40_003866 [Gnathostoma spinigerum]|uniref:Peptidase M13 N-terminal domain-containing protein n=1 Tax=Gnathostoma spinigerum TaxID=75299 RepID=A0ABD6ED12_9BILA